MPALKLVVIIFFYGITTLTIQNGPTPVFWQDIGWTILSVEMVCIDQKYHTNTQRANYN